MLKLFCLQNNNRRYEAECAFRLRSSLLLNVNRICNMLSLLIVIDKSNKTTRGLGPKWSWRRSGPKWSWRRSGPKSRLIENCRVRDFMWKLILNAASNRVERSVRLYCNSSARSLRRKQKTLGLVFRFRSTFRRRRMIERSFQCYKMITHSNCICFGWC